MEGKETRIVHVLKGDPVAHAYILIQTSNQSHCPLNSGSTAREARVYDYEL